MRAGLRLLERGFENGIFDAQEAVTKVTLVQLSGHVGSRLAKICRRGGTRAALMVRYRTVGEETARRKASQFTDSGNFQQHPWFAVITILRPPGRRTAVHLFPDQRTGLPTMHCRSSRAMCIVSWSPRVFCTFKRLNAISNHSHLTLKIDALIN